MACIIKAQRTSRLATPTLQGTFREVPLLNVTTFFGCQCAVPLPAPTGARRTLSVTADVWHVKDELGDGIDRGVLASGEWGEVPPPPLGQRSLERR